MEIKKIILFIMIHYTMPNLVALSVDDVKRIHQTEQQTMSRALTNLTSNLLSIESDLWINNIKKTRSITAASYPTVLSSDEIKKLTDAINTLSNFQDERKIRAYNPKLPSRISEDIFKQVKEDALRINEPTTAFAYTKKNYGFWKPITQRYFESAKCIIETFGKEIKKVALASELSVGEPDHYFPQPDAGEALRKL